MPPRVYDPDSYYPFYRITLSAHALRGLSVVDGLGHEGDSGRGGGACVRVLHFRVITRDGFWLKYLCSQHKTLVHGSGARLTCSAAYRRSLVRSAFVVASRHGY